MLAPLSPCLTPALCLSPLSCERHLSPSTPMTTGPSRTGTCVLDARTNPRRAQSACPSGCPHEGPSCPPEPPPRAVTNLPLIFFLRHMSCFVVFSEEPHAGLVFVPYR